MKVRVEIKVKARPKPGQTMGQLRAALVQAGNKIVTEQDDGFVIAGKEYHGQHSR
jgi:hypothetical protein